jgi:hypothetical protein
MIIFKVETQKWRLIDGKRVPCGKPLVMDTEYLTREEAEKDWVAHDQDFEEFGWASRIIELEKPDVSK